MNEKDLFRTIFTNAILKYTTEKFLIKSVIVLSKEKKERKKGEEAIGERISKGNKTINMLTELLEAKTIFRAVKI